MRPGGNRFGRYRLLERREEFEFGEAYLAKLVGSSGFEKHVVLWCLSRGLRADAGGFSGAMREAARGALLSHTNLAQVLDVGVVGDVGFVATEYIAGPTLEEVLRHRGTLEWPVAAHIACEVATGLSYVHQRRKPNGELLRLVHGRLTPGRIALGRSGDVKLTGFGRSWACPRLDVYVSPEELRCEPVDGRADVFALGSALRACLRSDAGVPDALRHALERALQPYPEHRSTAADLQRDLTEVLHSANRPVAPRDLTELALTQAPI